MSNPHDVVEYVRDLLIEHSDLPDDRKVEVDMGLLRGAHEALVYLLAELREADDLNDQNQAIIERINGEANALAHRVWELEEQVESLRCDLEEGHTYA